MDWVGLGWVGVGVGLGSMIKLRDQLWLINIFMILLFMKSYLINSHLYFSPDVCLHMHVYAYIRSKKASNKTIRALHLSEEVVKM